MTEAWTAEIADQEQGDVEEELLAFVEVADRARRAQEAVNALGSGPPGTRIMEPADTYPVVRFKVSGIARAQGSKRLFVNRYTGKPAAKESNERLPQWRSDIAQAAGQMMEGHELLAGPLMLGVLFVFARPASHFLKSGKLVKGAPDAPIGHNIGDTSKLVRAIEDAMEGIVYKDDCQISTHDRPRKRWGIAAATYITVQPDPLDP